MVEKVYVLCLMPVPIGSVMDDRKNAQEASLNPHHICGCTRPGEDRLDRARGYSELCHHAVSALETSLYRARHARGYSLVAKGRDTVDARSK